MTERKPGNESRHEVLSFHKEIFRMAKAAKKENRQVIDQLFAFFETGELPESIDPSEPDIPHFVRPRVIALNETNVAPLSVMTRHHLLLPLVKETFVTFTVVDEDEEVPSWRVMKEDETYETQGNAGWTFTTAVSLKQNLTDFYLSMTSPRPENSLSDGTEIVREWLLSIREQEKTTDSE